AEPHDGVVHARQRLVEPRLVARRLRRDVDDRRLPELVVEMDVVVAGHSLRRIEKPTLRRRRPRPERPPPSPAVWGRAQRETTQPSWPASKASLLHMGWIANWCEPSVMFCVFIHAHLSAFSLPDASFQPSWTVAKLSGSVTASEYSWPVTMLQPS